MFTSQTLSELLVLLLLVIVNVRFFFYKKIKNDTLSLVAVVCFALSVLVIIAFGLTIVNAAIFVISFFSALWNFRAFQRLCSGLVIDNFGLLAIFSSFINFLAALSLLIFIFHNNPTPVKEEKYSVKCSQEFYTQCDNFFFKKADGIFDKKNVKLWKIQESKDGFVSNQNNHLVLFVVPETSNLEVYKSFLFKLAKDGFLVYAAEVDLNNSNWLKGFYDLKFTRNFFSRLMKVKSPEKYNELCLEKEDLRIQKCAALLEIVNPTTENTVHFVFDGETSVMTKFYENYLMPWDTVFDLSSVENYKTAGYGPVENTDLVFSRILKVPVDKSFYISSHLASALEKLVYYYHE